MMNHTWAKKLNELQTTADSEHRDVTSNALLSLCLSHLFVHILSHSLGLSLQPAIPLFSILICGEDRLL